MKGNDVTTMLDDITYDEGTFAKVNCLRSALPRSYRTMIGKVDAVKRAPRGGWLGLFPNPDLGIGSDEEVGWPLLHNLTTNEIDRMGIAHMTGTHRGWFLREVSDIEVQTKDADEVAALKAEIARLKQEFEAFKVHASDVLGAAANEHDLCSAYDEVAEEAGLYRRESNQDVEIEVTYRQTITLRARTWEAARDKVDELMTTAYFEANSPFSNGDDITDFGSPYSLTVSVPD